MTILNKEQLDFLNQEFGLEPEEISKMSKEQWKQVRSDCFDIEAHEILAIKEQGYDIDEYSTEREEIASSIASIKYSELIVEEAA